jgi:hypothetical protein
LIVGRGDFTAQHDDTDVSRGLLYSWEKLVMGLGTNRTSTRVKEYQLFILTPEGCVKEHYTLKCAGDADARKRAGKFLTTYAVELWDGPRCVARFPSKIVERARLRPGRLQIEM